jgi:hypothetical protein
MAVPATTFCFRAEATAGRRQCGGAAPGMRLQEPDRGIVGTRAPGILSVYSSDTCSGGAVFTAVPQVHRAFRGPEKNLAGTKGPAKFEQGGFTSTRRRVRRPLSGRKSRKLVWSKSAPKFGRAQVSRAKNIQFYDPDHNREFVLARLQKPQCYERRAKPRRPEAAGTHPSRPSATLRSRKSRKTLIRFDERNSSG